METATGIISAVYFMPIIIIIYKLYKFNHQIMRIGIITIHRLVNFGTALQAYALQYYLQKETGHQIEIIDYIFPNSFHHERKRLIKKIRGYVRIILDYMFEKNMNILINSSSFKKIF